LYQRTSLFAERSREYVLVDSDPLKQGRTWRGLPISTPDRLREVDWTTVPLVISSYGSQERIAAAAARLGVPEACMVRLYANLRVY
jgi:hypothetical protein